MAKFIINHGSVTVEIACGNCHPPKKSITKTPAITKYDVYIEYFANSEFYTKVIASNVTRAQALDYKWVWDTGHYFGIEPCLEPELRCRVHQESAEPSPDTPKQSGDKYDIYYDYTDESGYEYRNNKEEFCGTWDELQVYLKEMRKGDCYNIDAVAHEE